MSRPLRVIPLGGLGEIGLNCMVLEYDDEIIVLDCGVMFSDLQLLGVEYVIPDMTYLKNNSDKIQAYIITHAHEDHIGALPYALKDHPAPVHSTRFARKLIEAKLEEHGILKETEIKTFSPGEVFGSKHFKVKAVPVNHSIVEAMALFIETPVGKVVFTGDFKIDASPFYGEPMDPKPFQKAGEEGVLLLMSDSTNVERDGHSLSESKIYGKFEEIFAKPTGLTVVAVFASNIARIGQIVSLAKKLGRKVAFLGRSMDQNSKIAFELGYLTDLRDVLIATDEIEDYDRKDVIVVSTGSQGEPRSALMRIARGEHRDIKLVPGDLVVMSSRYIPGNEKAIGRMINDLFRLGAEVLYEAVADIHVSGHANAGELRAMLNMTKPKFFIPVHGEYRHLVRHRKLAVSTGVDDDNARIAINGDVYEVTKDDITLAEHMEENRVLIEGEGGADVSKVILKDRRKVAEAGVVFAILIRNGKSGDIMGGPDIIHKGVLDDALVGDLYEKGKEVMIAILEDALDAGKTHTEDLQEEIRVGLRRYFAARIGKKPVVIPIVIDV